MCKFVVYCPGLVHVHVYTHGQASCFLRTTLKRYGYKLVRIIHYRAALAVVKPHPYRCLLHLNGAKFVDDSLSMCTSSSMCTTLYACACLPT